MAVPDHEAIVKNVNTAFPHLLKANTHASCGEFLQRVVAALPAGERWGLLSKDDGENGVTYPNGVRCSVDVVAMPDGSRVDVIQSAAAPPRQAVRRGKTSNGTNAAGEPQWRPHNVYVDVSGWPIYDSGTPADAGSAAACTLAYGWFCWMTALADWPDEELQNRSWIAGEIGPRVYRVMLCVEGESHGSPDSWLCTSVKIDATWEDRYKRTPRHGRIDRRPGPRDDLRRPESDADGRRSPAIPRSDHCGHGRRQPLAGRSQF